MACHQSTQNTPTSPIPIGVEIRIPLGLIEHLRYAVAIADQIGVGEDYALNTYSDDDGQVWIEFNGQDLA